jgi:hypothetical protein
MSAQSSPKSLQKDLLPNGAFEWFKFLLRTSQVPSSNIGPDTDGLWLFSVCRDRHLDGPLN